MDLKLPEQEDLFRFAEGVPARDPVVERQIRQILASNSLVRQEMSEIKKELYRLECQLPHYTLRPEFGADIAKMAQSWCAIRAKEKLSFQNFWKEKELRRVLFVLGFFLTVIALISRYLK